jgi:hypothetical protein
MNEPLWTRSGCLRVILIDALLWLAIAIVGFVIWKGLFS